MRVQVLLVGAGPTGLALACQCLRLGLRVRIIDKKRGPSLTSWAIGCRSASITMDRARDDTACDMHARRKKQTAMRVQ